MPKRPSRPKKNKLLAFALSGDLADRLRPWLLAGLTALLVCRPLFPSESVATEGDGLPVVMLWLGLACVWLVAVIGLPELPIRFWLVDGAVVVLVVIHTVLGVLAAARLSTRPAVNMLWEWIGMGVAFLLLRQLATGRRESRALIAVMVSLAVGLSCYGLYQYAYELPQTRASYAADPDAALRAAGVWYPPGSTQRYLFEQRLASPEPLTTFALTNSLAGFLAPWFVILVALAMTAWVQRRSFGLGIWAIASCAIIGLCLFLTKSRSAWLAVTIGLILAIFAYRHAIQNRLRRWLLVGVATIGPLLLVALLIAVFHRHWFDEMAKSFSYRLEYWQSTLEMIREHPILGCGPGNFQNAFTAYKLPTASEEVADPHNFLLEVWATAGTGGGLAMLAVLGTAVYILWPRSRTALRESGLRQAILDDPDGWHGAADGPAFFSDAVPDRPGFVVAGAIAGFPLAWIIGGMGAAPPGPIILWLVMPPALITLAVLRKWIRAGRLSAGIAALGALVLLVHLSASGGIGFPGVALSLWLLLAMALNLSEYDRQRVLPRTVTFAITVLALAAIVECYVTGYSPVLHSRGYLRLAQDEPERAEEWLQEAATADPFSVQPLEQLGAREFAVWRETGNERHLKLFEWYNNRALSLEPNSASAWLASGDYYFEVFRKTHFKGYIERVLRAYRSATNCYPNNPLYRAKLALANQAAGNMASFREEAATALELDAATPHVDKKLPEDLRQQLRQDTQL